MESWLIRNATVVTMDDDGRVLPEADILIEATEIAGLWPRSEAPQNPPEARAIDAAGMVAMPGMINAHTHCAMTLLRGYADDMPLMPWLEERIWPFEMKLQEDDVYWGTLLGIAEMIRGGVTCFNDMYHYFESTSRAVLDSGIRANVSGVLLAFLPDAKERLERAIEFAKQWKDKGDGLLVTMLGPHAPYTCPNHLLDRVIEGAHEAGVGIHIHVSETAQEVTDSQRDFSQTPVERLKDIGLLDVSPVLAAHCVHLTDSDIATLVESQVGISHNPGSNMKLASGTAPIPKLLEANAIVGLGTDGAASNNNLDILEEARLAALLHKLQADDPTVVAARQALCMATRGGARALGIHHRVGQIKPGMKADLVLLDFRLPHLFPRHDVVSHLVYAARAGDVRTVFVNGRPLMIDRQLQTLDEDEIFGQVTERLKRLVQ
ncbi:MAG: amidohydrolase [Armatimonadota bacterium]|nr:MAG: amidohydrolase [Armatimonadota bacterium]